MTAAPVRRTIYTVPNRIRSNPQNTRGPMKFRVALSFGISALLLCGCSGASAPDEYFFPAVLGLRGDRLLCHTSDEVHEFDKQTGKQLRKASVGSAYNSSFAGDYLFQESSDCPQVFSIPEWKVVWTGKKFEQTDDSPGFKEQDGVLYYRSGANTISRVSLQDRKEIGSAKIESVMRYRWSLITIGSDELLVVPYEGKKTELAIVNAKTGDVRAAWSFDTARAPLSPICFENGKAYFADGKFLRAIDLVSAKKLWELPLEDQRIKSTPIMLGGVLVVVTERCIMKGIECETGKVLWSTDEWDRLTGYKTNFTLVGSGNTVVCSNGRNLMQAVDVRTGKSLWSFDGEMANDAPIVTDASAVYIGIRDGLQALDLSTGKSKWSNIVAHRKEAKK